MQQERKPVFDCVRCGQCCTGEGGIVVGPHDQERLATHLHMTVEVFLRTYTQKRADKYLVRTGEDGRCVFFRDGAGCIVHTAKPDVCRAWPFFRGNMVDPVSFAMAKEFCPGIAKDATHEAFVAEGREYLREQRLEAHDGKHEANALLPE